MFTGLIQAVGILAGAEHRPDGRLLRIRCPELADAIAVDDSIASNGVCLTAVAVDAEGFSAHAIPVTLEKTTLGGLHEGARINLELALRMGDRLGGHLVQGHVNATGRVLAVTERGDNRLIRVAYPAEQRRYLMAEGSITVDGVSLTVAALDDDALTVSLIPHTLARTNLRDRTPGDAVNLEVDAMAKYVESLLRGDPALAARWLPAVPA
jgi:riboflavin synthase